MKTCERCGYAGWLYWFQGHRVCASCWEHAAHEAATAKGERRINFTDRKRVHDPR